jgi:putative membrane protein
MPLTRQIQLALVALLTALLALSLFGGPYPREQWLQHLPTAVSLIALGVAAGRGWLSTPAFTCLAAMLALHIVGARWIYSYVPYERWCDALFGSGPREWFGWRRNHYDRLVHLMFGLLMPLPLVELATRYGGLSRRWAATVAFGAVGAISAIYEVLEWLLAIIAAPEVADRYNGQQGDAWDAQKDMALAIVGSLLVLPCLMMRGRQTPPAPTTAP